MPHRICSRAIAGSIRSNVRLDIAGRFESPETTLGRGLVAVLRVRHTARSVHVGVIDRQLVTGQLPQVAASPITPHDPVHGIPRQSCTLTMAPKVYDPNSENEQAPPLPSAPLRILAPNIVLQPPLTRRGSGPGVVLLMPDASKLKLNTGPRPLDPEPVQKWAEEGFAVVAVSPSESEGRSLNTILKQAIDTLIALDEVDVRDKFAIIGTSFTLSA